MKKIRMYTASPLGETGVEGVTIVLDLAVPELGSLDEARSLYESQATLLAVALTDSLPQGTLDRLLICLMERCASLYRGRAGT